MTFGIGELAAGIVYVYLVAGASGAKLNSVLSKNFSIKTTAYSDTLSGYRGMDPEFAGQETIRGWGMINGIEGFWALAKVCPLASHDGRRSLPLLFEGGAI